MSTLSFSGLLIVAGIAFAIPLVLSLTPARSLPASILEIVAGIIIGPSGFGWVRVDAPIQLLSLIGLDFIEKIGLDKAAISPEGAKIEVPLDIVMSLLRPDELKKLQKYIASYLAKHNSSEGN